MIQRTEARQRMSLLINSKDYSSFANEIVNLTENDFNEALNALNSSNKYRIENSTIIKLLNKVQSVAANIQGSKASLSHRRNDIRAYIIHFGTPHFYLTINPNDVHSPLILKIGGIDFSNDVLGDKYVFRLKFLKENPVIQSIYFDLIIRHFVKFLLRYKNNTIRQGILGELEAYYGCVETADRGSLHSHFLVWLLNGLNPDEFRENLKSSNFKKRMISFIDSIIHCDYEKLTTLPFNNTKENLK